MSSIKINMYVCFEIDHFVFSEDLTWNCYLSFVNIKNRVDFLQSLCYNGLILHMTKIFIFWQQISGEVFWMETTHEISLAATWSLHYVKRNMLMLIFRLTKLSIYLTQKIKNQIEDFVWNLLFKNKAYFSRNLLLVYFKILV